MKLNHLILVICTGILVGFSACKKDPFTEKDAIEAQKELITLKAGYDLAIKNVELAIQKAADEAQITITKLQIQGASDLSKQEAAQAIARDLAQLQNQWRDLVYRDSLQRAQVIATAQTLSFMAALLQENGNPYLSGQWSVRENETRTLVPGATLRFIPADKSTYVTLTANAEGQIRYSNLLLYPNERMYLSAPNKTNKVFAMTVYRARDIHRDQNIYIYSYDPTATYTVSGTIRAALDLTNNAEEPAGAGLLVVAASTFQSYDSYTDSTSADIEIPTVTNASSAYSLTLPDNVDNALGNHYLYFPAFVKGYQRAYTNWKKGQNPFQSVPSITDSLLVHLKPGLGTYRDVTNYYLALPDEDGEDYKMTLTDPLKIIARAVQAKYGADINANGERQPDGTITNESNTLPAAFSYNVDGFVLNNGWFNAAPSDNEANQYIYNVPLVITPDSTDYKAYIDTPQADKDLIAQAYITDLILTGGNPTAVWTPAITFDTTAVLDTLAVDLVDLSGFFVATAPELSVSIDENGALESIIFEEDANTGLFNIQAALDLNASFDAGWLALFTNRERNAAKISGEDRGTYYEAFGFLEVGPYSRTTNSTSQNVYYGGYASTTYYPASERPNGPGSALINTSTTAYFPSGIWTDWVWTPAP